MNTTYISEFRNPNSFRNPKVLAEIAIFTALATALSLIVIYVMPQGGSITLASMVPIIWLALRRGPKIGIATGILYGIIQFMLLPYAIDPVQVLLDYPLAFAVLGLAGFFQTRPVVGAAVGISWAIPDAFHCRRSLLGSHIRSKLKPNCLLSRLQRKLPLARTGNKRIHTLLAAEKQQC